MANLASSVAVRQVGPAITGIQVPIKSGSKIYQGAMVARLIADGMSVRAGTAATGPVQGVAQAEAAQPSADGGANVNLLTGVFAFAPDGTNPPGDAHLGKIVYASDDNTISTLNTAGPKAGVLVGFEAGSGWPLVFISPEAVLGGLQASGVLNFGVPGAVPGSVDLTLTVAGAALGDPVSVAAPITVGANYLLTAFVSAANTVTIRWTQIAGAAADPDGAGGTYRVTVHK